MTFRIYTKTGDKGKTALIGGTKVSKAHLRIEAYGNVDELNSFIGLCSDALHDAAGKKILQEIQDRLFTAGAVLAQDPGKHTKMQLPDLHETDIELLEQEIDRMTAVLPEMKSFIVPGGSIAVSYLHVARCICRRAERSCVRLQEEEPVAEIVIKYLNRLSDYLFTLARYTGHLAGIADIPWRPRT
ncbi:cob(I)yrinic acid a,c-diamide adenosyltransferase [Niabella beijingensis]|uniref:cob(I)yrinic acid a,c-diamide adenosyltransferase n=1 Tax=Niabella beijingensis TaxID=2872700 RepID=UPI001CC03803|nr:cob(I)yrinic acid a,c-diamide adenosyltransferase [Niabella beijingensis]MBZ4188200.1 cob(I)yrinic acid a,c-diamide adenosyltransferase [Niabella beijingensis]